MYEWFFNKSSFLITPLEEQVDINPDEAFVVHLYVYDQLAILKASNVVFNFYVISGRNKTKIDSSNWTITNVSDFLWKVEGTIPSSVWDGEKRILGVAEITTTLSDNTEIKVKTDFDFVPVS